MKKIFLFVLIWQGYVVAADGELRQLFAPSSTTSMSVNGDHKEGAPHIEMHELLAGDPIYCYTVQASEADLNRLSIKKLEKLRKGLHSKEMGLLIKSDESREFYCKLAGASLTPPITCAAAFATVGGILATPLAAFYGAGCGAAWGAPLSVAWVRWLINASHAERDAQRGLVVDEIKRVEGVIKLKRGY